jgi:hypothetical protein
LIENGFARFHSGRLPLSALQLDERAVHRGGGGANSPPSLKRIAFSFVENRLLR